MLFHREANIPIVRESRDVLGLGSDVGSYLERPKPEQRGKMGPCSCRGLVSIPRSSTGLMTEP